MITKYVRTKEHVYKRLFADKAIINESGYGTCDKELNPIGETIIKESDDLSELCDELVAENRTGYRWLAYITTKTYEDSEGNIIEYKAYGNKYSEVCSYNLIDDIKHERVKIYGAIWVTDENGVPTLKPVSKVNEKGELELIWLKN